MRVEFDVELLDRGGVPQARVPSEKAWDLVDYLANQRVQVTYSFESERLLVNFHHMDLPAARSILNTWRQTTEREAALHAPNSVTHEDQWLVGARTPGRRN